SQAYSQSFQSLNRPDHNSARGGIGAGLYHNFALALGKPCRSGVGGGFRYIIEARGLRCVAFSAFERQQRRSAMKVKEVMHKGVDWVSPDTPVTEIAKLMQGHDIGCIPVGENDHLVGMVTDRDIVCKGLAAKNFDASRATAR